MAGSLLFYLKLLSLCFVGVTVAREQTENTLKRSRREGPDNDQNSQLGKSGKDKESADGTDINDNMRNQRPKNVKKLPNRRRCFLGSPYDCPVGFEDSLLDWPRPWGWVPGPLYPEYGPDLHRGGWGGHGGRFGCNQFGYGGPWRVPGCSYGCGNRGWCCCGQEGGGGGGGASDCAQFSDAPPSQPNPIKAGAPSSLHPFLGKQGCGQEGGGGGGGASDCAQFSDAPPSQPNPIKAGAPSSLHPFLGKQANSKGPGEIKQGKDINVQGGRKRQDITYGASPDVAQASPVYDNPYQATYGNWQVPQQTSPADQVVGGLFFWNMDGKNMQAKKQKRKH